MEIIKKKNQKKQPFISDQTWQNTYPSVIWNINSTPLYCRWPWSFGNPSLFTFFLYCWHLNWLKRQRGYVIETFNKREVVVKDKLPRRLKQWKAARHKSLPCASQPFVQKQEKNYIYCREYIYIFLLNIFGNGAATPQGLWLFFHRQIIKLYLFEKR